MTIRRIPGDFLVHERPSRPALESLRDTPGPISAGRFPFAWYELTKQGLTTPDACAFLAKALGLKPGAVAWAGLKDRHAHTRQLVSAGLGPRGRAAGDGPRDRAAPRGPDASAHARGAFAPPTELSGPNWSARLLGFAAHAVSAECVEANDFTIVVRRLQRKHTGVFAQRVAALAATTGAAAGTELLIANYFGDQRFGSARHHRGFAAHALLRGDFATALELLMATPARKDHGPWRAFTRACAEHWGNWPRLLEILPRRPERACIEVLAAGGGGGTMRDAFAALPAFTQQICVEAYQSWLWNRAAADLAERLDPAPIHAQAGDDFGAMLFPRARFIDDATEHLTMPMPAPGIVLHEPWGPILANVLKQQGLTADALVIPGLRRPAFGAALRPLFVRASAFQIEDPRPDDLAAPNSGLFKRTLRFTLPRGAYATVVLRALGQ